MTVAKPVIRAVMMMPSVVMSATTMLISATTTASENPTQTLADTEAWHPSQSLRLGT
jgi:hypothetical protein